MSSSPCIAALTGKSLKLLDGNPPFEEKTFRGDDTPNIRNILFSPKGNYLVYKTDKKTELVRCSDWSVVLSIPGPIKEFGFSRFDTYFMTWEVMFHTEENPGKPNLHIYKAATGERLISYGQKSQVGWEVQWSGDEKIHAWKENSRILIYEGQMERYTHQIMGEKFQNFSVSPSVDPSFYIAAFTPGKSGQPSIWKVFKHPEYKTPVAVKSSFQADRCTFHWNRRGTNLLVLTQTELDKTGASYYGKQTLSYADVKGNAGPVTFSKEGPIHAVAWSPGNWNEWVGVYGNMPARATVFTAKCEPLFEFGSASWNNIYYSPDGARVLLAGFGNISSGCVEVWEPRGRRLGAFTARDTTFLQWDPRAECVLTASTYPRLTVSNGYKIWHYTGALLNKTMLDGHLLGIAWQPGAFPKTELSSAAPPSIADGDVQASAQAYRPPAARGRPAAFKLHDNEPSHRPGEAASTPSKAAIKQKEKREKAKARKAEERAAAGAGEGRDEGGAGTVSAPPRPSFQSTGDPDKDKKIKNLQKKLNDITKLKEAVAAGRPLELNQKAKIDTEAALLKELEQLKL